MTQSGNAKALAQRTPDGRNTCAVADVLALLHCEVDAHPAAAYGLGLAEMLGAHLTVVGLARDPSRQLHLAQAPAEILAAAVEAERKAASTFASKIAKSAEDRGVPAIALARETQIGRGWGEIAQFARAFDIAVLARPAAEEAARDQAMLESVLLQAGRSVMAVPPSYRGPPSFARPLVAWDGSRSAVRALAEAMPILRHVGRARVVTVVGQRSAAALAPEIAPHIERYGIACVSQHTPQATSVANTLLEQARATDSDLIVMGAYGHSRLREIVLGGTTRSMLMLADLPVLLAF